MVVWKISKARSVLLAVLTFMPGVSSTCTIVSYKNMKVSSQIARNTRKLKSHMEAHKMLSTFDVSVRVDVIISRARPEEIERLNKTE